MIDLEAEAYKAEQARRCIRLGQTVLHSIIRDALSPHAEKLEKRMAKAILYFAYPCG